MGTLRVESGHGEVSREFWLELKVQLYEVCLLCPCGQETTPILSTRDTGLQLFGWDPWVLRKIYKIPHLPRLSPALSKSVKFNRL